MPYCSPNLKKNIYWSINWKFNKVTKKYILYIYTDIVKASYLRSLTQSFLEHLWMFLVDVLLMVRNVSGVCFIPLQCTHS